MSLNASQVKCAQMMVTLWPVRFVGGTAAVTEELGNGVTVTYIGTGLVDVTWAEFAGQYMGLVGAPSFDATTASGLKGFTCVPGDFNTTTRTVRLSITNASEALTDLAAAQHVTCWFAFRTTSA